MPHHVLYSFFEHDIFQSVAVIYWNLSYSYSNINFLAQLFAMLTGFVFHFADSNENNMMCVRLLARIVLSIHIAVVVLVIFFRSNPERVEF